MLVFHPFTRFVFVSELILGILKNSIQLSPLFLLNDQVERGKQAKYCYDDAELKMLQSSFPPNASYNIQRFKG